MPRWEVCQIELHTWEERGAGFLAGTVHMTRWRAVLCAPNEVSIVAESDAWKIEAAPPEGHRDRWLEARTRARAEARSLIAQLGYDGWDPMPLCRGQSSDIDWYFKRQIISE